MARAFVSASSQGLQSTLALSAYNQASISVWLKWTAFASDDKLAFEYSANANSNNGAFFIDPDGSTSGKFEVFWNTAAGGTRVSFTRPSAGVWHHYLILIDGTSTAAAALPTIYLDGVSQSLTVNQSAAGTQSFGNFALNFMCRNQASLFADGSMAEVAIWAASSGNRGGALLSAGEASGLANGARAVSVRTSSLAYWWPIDGLVSAEPDFGGTAANATLTNAPTLAAGPPIMQFTPRWNQFNTFVASAVKPWPPFQLKAA